MSSAPVVDGTSVVANLFVAFMVALGLATGNYALRNKGASGKMRFIATWLSFDAICHLTLEASFLFHSFYDGGVQYAAHYSPLAKLWLDYAKADARWATDDPTVVCIEVLTVLVAGPLAAYCVWLISRNSPAYHYWVIVLCTGEIYGGWMTFGPEWVSNPPNQNLTGTGFVHFWIELVFMNIAWVIIPGWLMYDSWVAISSALKISGAGLPLPKGAAAGQRALKSVPKRAKAN